MASVHNLLDGLWYRLQKIDHIKARIFLDHESHMNLIEDAGPVNDGSIGFGGGGLKWRHLPITVRKLMPRRLACVGDTNLANVSESIPHEAREIAIEYILSDTMRYAYLDIET